MPNKSTQKRTNFQNLKPRNVDPTPVEQQPVWGDAPKPIPTPAVDDTPAQPLPSTTETKTKWDDVVAMEYLSVRSAPSSSAPVLLYLTRGRTYQVELSGKPWLKVTHPKLEGRVGYVSCTILNNQVRK